MTELSDFDAFNRGINIGHSRTIDEIALMLYGALEKCEWCEPLQDFAREFYRDYNGVMSRSSLSNLGPLWR